jgi:CRISPR-associated endonuclease/helicase Cas3
MTFYSYWGKSDSPNPDSFSYHPLVFHSLDVAACGQVLLRARSGWLSNIERVSGISQTALTDWLTFLLAIHDLGKFSDGFQNKIPQLFETLQRRKTRATDSDRHDVLGFSFCKNKLPGWLGGKYQVGGWDTETLRDHLSPWLAAVNGHHGRPPKAQNPYGPLLDEQFPESVGKDIFDFMEMLIPFLLPEGMPFQPEGVKVDFYEAFPKASWLVAGLAVAADWLGSNRNWFPYCGDTEIPLREYWQKNALPQARLAVQESGLSGVDVATFQGLKNLYNFVTPTSLQRLSESVEIPESPQLFIAEEVTGGGKTEAAIVLAQRLMARGLGDSLFLALPTMATADAMHERVRKIYHQLFKAESSPSLVLAHSMARIRKLGLEEKNRSDDGYRGEEEPSASQACSRWLSDSRKKALLADVGVGTIDQALLSVLPVKHQSLRLLGLSRKILVVDEVHACDAYVLRLLCRLLKFHAAWGGSAILLSATLPMGMRAKLLEAFAEGAGWAVPQPQQTGYPLLTHLSSENLAETSFEANLRLARSVRVDWLRDEPDVWKAIGRTLEKGQCACWVRNTVADSMEAYGEAVKRFGKEKVRLFHARFAMGDRLRKGQSVLADFGPKSEPVQRAGKLVIATQVVEQSLDLDFDYMVTDMAPMDLILQRAGRLMRHPRDMKGNLVQEGDQRGDVVLGVLMPEATEDAGKKWYSNLFPKAAWVYPHHGHLWLAAQWLQKKGGFSVPGDSRDMMETVYGEDFSENLPEALKDVELEAEGKDKADSALAGFNALELELGYIKADTKWDDMNAPTRLGQPTIMVRLARQKEGIWGPWWDGGGNPWENSQLSVRMALVAEDAAEDKTITEALRKTMSDEGRYCVVIPLHEKDGRWVGKALDVKKKAVSIEYDAEFGFRFMKGDDE